LLCFARSVSCLKPCCALWNVGKGWVGKGKGSFVAFGMREVHMK